MSKENYQRQLIWRRLQQLWGMKCMRMITCLPATLPPPMPSTRCSAVQNDHVLWVPMHRMLCQILVAIARTSMLWSTCGCLHVASLEHRAILHLAHNLFFQPCVTSLSHIISRSGAPLGDLERLNPAVNKVIAVRRVDIWVRFWLPNGILRYSVVTQYGIFLF